MLRRVELHGRPVFEGESPWSIRQTAVYHRIKAPTVSKDLFQPTSTSMFLLIAPSAHTERQLCEYLDATTSGRVDASPSALHLLLVEDSLTGWMDYMAWLEKQLKEQVWCIILISLRRPSAANTSCNLGTPLTLAR